MAQGIWLYAKIGTGPAEWVERLDDLVKEPRVGELLTVQRTGERHAGTKPFEARCTDIKWLGDTENLFLLALE